MISVVHSLPSIDGDHQRQQSFLQQDCLLSKYQLFNFLRKMKQTPFYSILMVEVNVSHWSWKKWLEMPLTFESAPQNMFLLSPHIAYISKASDSNDQDLRRLGLEPPAPQLAGKGLCHFFRYLPAEIQIMIPHEMLLSTWNGKTPVTYQGPSRISGFVS